MASNLPPGVTQADIDRAAGVEEEAHEEAFFTALIGRLRERAQERKREAERMDVGTPGHNLALEDMRQYQVAAQYVENSQESDDVHWLRAVVQEAMGLAYTEGRQQGMADESQARDYEQDNKLATQAPVIQELLEAGQLAAGTLGAIAQDHGENVDMNEARAVPNAGQVAYRLQTALNAYKELR